MKEPKLTPAMSCGSAVIVVSVLFVLGHAEVVFNKTDVFVLSCTRGLPPDPINTTLHGGPNCTVHVGTDGSLAPIDCDVTVEALGSFTADFPTVVIDARKDTRSLTWMFLERALRISNGGDTMPTEIILENANVHILFGEGPNDVDIHQLPYDTAMVFPAGDSGAHRVRIRGTTNTLLLNGSYTLTVGDDSDMVPQTPFEYIHGQVALGPQGSTGNVSNNTVTVGTPVGRPDDIKQVWRMDSFTLSQVLDEQKPLTMPSKWMLKRLEENSFFGSSYCSTCTLLYTDGFRKKFSFSTGGNTDTFVGVNVTAMVTVSLGANDDSLQWWSPRIDTPVAIDMGTGTDHVLLVAPLSSTLLNVDNWAGSSDFNDVTVYMANYSANDEGNMVCGVGPNPRDCLTIVGFVNNSDSKNIKDGLPP